MIKPLIQPLFCCFTTACILTAVCRFIREKSGHISVFLSQAHENLGGEIPDHPSSSLPLQLEKAQEHWQVSCSAIPEMLLGWAPNAPCSQWEQAQAAALRAVSLLPGALSSWSRNTSPINSEGRVTRQPGNQSPGDNNLPEVRQGVRKSQPRPSISGH